MWEIIGKSNFSLGVKAVMVRFTLVHGHNERSGDRSRGGGNSNSLMASSAQERDRGRCVFSNAIKKKKHFIRFQKQLRCIIRSRGLRLLWLEV